MMIIMPVFMLTLFGYAISFDVNHVKMALLDQDKSKISREFALKFTHSGYFDLAQNLSSSSQFNETLDSGKARLILNLPSDFSKNLLAQKSAAIQVLVDGSDPTVASSAIGYFQSISEEYILEKQALGAPPIKLVTRIWYNPNLRSLNFFVPGLICVILMMMSATLTSQTIVSEKEKGTMESLVVSPIKKNELLLGKLLPYISIAFIDVITITAVGSLWFNVPIKGSLILLFVSSLIFFVGAMGLGMLISTNAKTSQEAMMIALLATLLPTELLSGFIFPIENMPWILQGITYLIPARYFLTILRGIFLKGIGLNYLWPSFLLLIIFAVAIMTLSSKRFKKRIG